MTKFGELVAEALAKANMSQRTLGIKVQEHTKSATPYSQTKVSRWLSGASPLNDRVKRAIASILEIDDEELRSAKTADDIEVSPHFGLTVQEYFAELSVMLKSYTTKGYTCDAFFLGPDMLPALSYDNIYERWIDNMRNGHDYHFLWLYDYISIKPLKKMNQLLTEINDSLLGMDWKPEFGKMYLYACAAINPKDEKDREDKRAAFNIITENVRLFDWCKAFELKSDTPGFLTALMPLYGFAQSWATIICYLANDEKAAKVSGLVPAEQRGLAPFASISSEYLVPRCSAKKTELNFLWFNDEKAEELKTRIDAFKRFLKNA